MEGKQAGTKNYSLEVRLVPETNATLNALCRESGKSRSQVVRELIHKGKIDVIHNGKELVRDIADVHKKFNQYSSIVRGDIQAIKEDIKQLNLNVNSHETPGGVFRLYLAKAMLRLDDIQQQHDEYRRACTRALPAKEDKYGNF